MFDRNDVRMSGKFEKTIDERCAMGKLLTQ